MELFDKEIPNNLSKHSLKKAAKSKKKIERVIVANLPFLVEFYFDKYQKPDTRAKYERTLLQLLGSQEYFVEPLRRVVDKLAKKKDLDELPEGLVTLLMDNLDDVRAMYRKQIAKMDSNDRSKSSDVTSSRIETIKELSARLIQETTEICQKINQKFAKKLVKEIGIERKYANELACCYVPAEYMTPRNIRRYAYRLNLTLYAIQGNGVKKTDPNNTGWTNECGVNLSDPEVIKRIYELFFTGINRKSYIAMLVGIMLERRGERINHFSEPQRWIYNDINKVVLDVLEGKSYLNLEGKKVSKKKAKKVFTINKKELKAFMKMYSDEKARDGMRNNDSPRRISFTSLSEEEYPKLHKAFVSCNKDYFNDLFNDDYREKNRHNNQNKNQNQNNNNQNRNNSNDRNNNRNR